MIDRKKTISIYKSIVDLKSMVFLVGPRQSGKTTLSKKIQSLFANSVYFNWDIIKDKKKVINDPAFFEKVQRNDNSKPLIVYDELHKYSEWKNYLKGIYDEFYDDYKILVTGSGRLDLFQKGKDSLAGRYLLLHLFPFTLNELTKKKRNKIAGLDVKSCLLVNKKSDDFQIWNQLFQTGGFPEPFTKGTETFFNQWTNLYMNQIISEDIRSFADIKYIDKLELLYSLLPDRIGSPLSINSLAKDLQVAFDTVKKWLLLFNQAYLTFHISSWSHKISRSILKEKKIYLFNYPEIEDKSSRFENMVALELYRLVTIWNDLGYGKYGLFYIRDKDKKEVDFLITYKNKPVLLVEVKLSETKVIKTLKNFQLKLKIPAIQLVNEPNVFISMKNDRFPYIIISAHDWLSSL